MLFRSRDLLFHHSGGVLSIRKRHFYLEFTEVECRVFEISNVDDVEAKFGAIVALAVGEVFAHCFLQLILYVLGFPPAGN